MLRIKKMTVSKTLAIIGIIFIGVDILPGLLGLSVYGGTLDIYVKDEWDYPLADVTVTWVSLTDMQGYNYPVGMVIGTTDQNGETHPGMTADGTYEFLFEKVDYTSVTKFKFILGTALGGQDESYTLYVVMSGSTPPSPTNPPEGYFEINGVEVTDTSVVVFSHKQMAIDFYATSGALSINNVFVEVKNMDDNLIQVVDINNNPVNTPLDLQQQTSTKWSTVFDLPREGKFVINGYINWDPGQAFPDENLQKMSILGGDYKTSPFGMFGWMSGIGLVFIVASVITAKPQFLRRKKR